MEIEIDQYDLNNAVFDTSFNGGYIKFYEQLKEALDQFDEKIIEDMKGTLIFSNRKINLKGLDKIEIIYLYSQLI